MLFPSESYKVLKDTQIGDLLVALFFLRNKNAKVKDVFTFNKFLRGQILKKTFNSAVCRSFFI